MTFRTPFVLSLSPEESTKPVSTVLTQVVIDPYDEASADEKIIGRVLNAEEAEAEEGGGNFVTKVGEGQYRRILAAPKPQKIVEIETVKVLSAAEQIVIAAGGGGIPVLEQGTQLNGASAIIEKDLAAGLLAEEPNADTLMILTRSVEKVSLDHNTDHESYLDTISQKMPRKYIYLANSLRQAPCFLKSRPRCFLYWREPDAVPSSQTWPMQKTATVRRPELSLNNHFTDSEYKMKCEPSLYMKISRRRLLVLPTALRDIFYTVWLWAPITVPQLIGQSVFQIFAQRSQPSSPHSGGYLHGHGCRKISVHTVDLGQISGDTRQGIHPSPVPHDHNRHSMQEKGSLLIISQIHGSADQCTDSFFIVADRITYILNLTAIAEFKLSRSCFSIESHPLLHGSGS